MFLFEDIEKEIKGWMQIIEDTTLPCIHNEDLRYYLWLRTLLNAIEKKDQTIGKLLQENLLFSEMVRGKKSEVPKNSPSAVE